MTRIRYRDLTIEQRHFVCNGCGGKGGIKVPSFVWNTACHHHDFNYWLGWREQDREKADGQFLSEMRREIRSDAHWIRWPHLYAIAQAYYWAVRIKGSGYFHLGDREQTLEDLIMQMQANEPKRSGMKFTGKPCAPCDERVMG